MAKDDAQLSAQQNCVIEVDSQPYEVYFSPEFEAFFIPESPLDVDKEWRLLHTYSELSRELEDIYFQLLHDYELYLLEKKNQSFCESALVNKNINDSLQKSQCILIKIADFNKIKAKIESKKGNSTTNIYEKVEQFSQLLYEKQLLDEHFKKSIVILDQQRIEFKNDWTKAVLKGHDAINFKDMLELMPVLAIDKQNKGGNRVDNRFVYIRRDVISTDKFEKITVQQLNQSTHQGGSTQHGSQSFIIKDKNGHTHYQFGQLAKQIFDLKNLIPKLKNNPITLSSSIKIDLLTTKGQLFEWAKELEDTVKIHQEWDNASITFDTQIMRYVTTASISSRFDPIKNKIKINGNIGGVFTAFDGFLKAETYIPHYLGKSLSIKSAKMDSGYTDTYPLGSIRLVFGSHLSCFVGASAYINSQLSFSVVKNSQGGNDKLVLSGDSSQKSEITSISELNKRMDGLKDGLSIDANLFTGASIDIGIFSGSLQWLKPIDYYFSSAFLRKFEQNYPIPYVLNGNHLKDSIKREFEIIAQYSIDIAGQVGIGGGFALYCYFDIERMKFFIKVHAALCFGKGAKGEVHFYVDGGVLLTFAKWVVYQLLQSNYAKLDYIDSSAYSQLNSLGSWLYTTSLDISAALDRKQNDEFKMQQTKFLHEISCNGNNAAKLQLELAEKLLKPNNHRAILYCLPETKALFLAVLTHRTEAADSYQDNTSKMENIKQQVKEQKRLRDALIFHYRLREAVLKILRSIQTKREWDRVMELYSLDSDIAEKIRTKEVSISHDDIISHNKTIEDFMLELQHYYEKTNLSNNPKSYQFGDFNYAYAELLNRIYSGHDELMIEIGDNFSLTKIYDSLLDQPAVAHCIVENNSVFYHWQKTQSE